MKEEDDDDPGLFRHLMTDATPLKHESTAPVPRRVSKKARFARADERDVLQESLGADVDQAESMNGDGLRFCQASVGRRTFRKLQRGGFSVRDELDLHGMTAEEAHDALKTFVNDSCRRGHTCVRVVHGKGLGSGHHGPVLKRKVDKWLRRWDPVLAFVSARQVDGGTGAVYVLLRKA